MSQSYNQPLIIIHKQDLQKQNQFTRKRDMDNSMNNGVMAVFAVSGSVVFLAMQAHKRLLSNFMKEMESHVLIKHPTGEIMKNERQRKVRFADDVAGELVVAKECCGKHKDIKEENLEGVPKNWLVMYEGILQSRNLRGSQYF